MLKNPLVRVRPRKELAYLSRTVEIGFSENNSLEASLKVIAPRMSAGPLTFGSPVARDSERLIVS